MELKRSELLVQIHYFTVHLLVGHFNILGALMRIDNITACHPPLLFFPAPDAENSKGFLPSLREKTKIPLENLRAPSAYAAS